MRAPSWVSFSLVVCGVIALGAGETQPQRFRARVVLVPLDVRVLDRDNQPIVDLGPADFTILEDGVPQEIVHFSTLGVQRQPVTSPVADTLVHPELEGVSSAGRTFLIVLGRGRLQHPAKGLDGVIDFVRAQLHPGDRVAVLAYNRVTEATTDHPAVVRFLDRYRERHERIEGMLDGDRRRASGGRGVSPKTSEAVESLFDAPGLPQVRSLPGYAGMTSYSNLRALLSGIDYLRPTEGEKHLLFLFREGPDTIGVTSARDLLSRRAATARTTISPIQTGGLGVSGFGSGENAQIYYGRPDSELWNLVDMRALAEDTGGVASYYRYARETVQRLNKATQFQYLLGYYPTNSSPDTNYRRVSVAVKRSGVTTLYRHGYQPRPADEPSDIRSVVTAERIEEAGRSAVSVRQLGVNVAASLEASKDGGGTLRILVTIDRSGVPYIRQGDLQTAELDLAVFAGDARQALLAHRRGRIELKLPSGTPIPPTPIQHETTLTISRRPAYVKAIVYHYDRDRLGSATVRVR
jgi:VWFA-related protein